MRDSSALFGLPFRISLRPAVLAASLTLLSCGEGGDLGCGGPFCVVPPGQPEATRLAAGAGNGQSGAPGRELPLPLEALVTDDEGRPVPDVEVSFTVSEGGGTTSDATVRSDIQGRAQVKWTLGAEAGPQSLLAAAIKPSGFHLAGSPLTLSAQSAHPGAARLVLSEAPSVSAQNGIAFTRQPVLAVFDADDQAVPQASVTVAIAAGGGTLSGATTVATDAAGRATFTDLAIVGVTGPRTLAFSVTGAPLEGPTAPVDLLAGLPSRIVGNEPLVYEGIVNSPVSPNPSVVVTDDVGNPVPGAAVSFVADQGGSVSPETATTDELGIARVAGWTLGVTADVQYSLSARLEPPSGDPVVFSAAARPGAAGTLRITRQPSATARSGTPLDRQPVVQIVDQLGNPAPQPGVTITAALSAGPSAALEGASATTNGSGRATFRSLTLTGLAGDYTLSFGAPALGGVASDRISLAAGPPVGLALLEQPAPTGRSRAPLSRQPVIQLQDDRGNPVALAGVEVTASVATGGGALGGGTRVVTGGDGRAAYDDLAIIGSPGPRTLRFASSSPAVEVISGQVTLPAVAAIAILAAPPEAVVVGTVLTNPAAWSLTDAAGLPVPDAPVTISVSPGNSVEPSSAASDGSGIVQLQTWTVSQTAGEHRVQLQVAAGGTSRVTLLATPGAASRLEKTSGDGQSAPINSVLPAPLVVRVLDGFGNGVSGVLVQWRTCEGVGDYDAVTDAGGHASALQATGPEPGPYCTMASSPGLVDSPVQFTYTATATEGSVSGSSTRNQLLRQAPAPARTIPRP